MPIEEFNRKFLVLELIKKKSRKRTANKSRMQRPANIFTRKRLRKVVSDQAKISGRKT